MSRNVALYTRTVAQSENIFEIIFRNKTWLKMFGGILHNCRILFCPLDTILRARHITISRNIDLHHTPLLSYLYFSINNHSFFMTTVKRTDSQTPLSRCIIEPFTPNIEITWLLETSVKLAFQINTSRNCEGAPLENSMNSSFA